MSNITFIGMGAMGTRMATRCLKFGHNVVVFNRSPDRCQTVVDAGAKAAETIPDAVKDADFVVSMVKDLEASRNIWLGEGSAAGSMKKDAVAIDCSTVTPEWSKELGNHFNQLGVAFVEAPVVGSRPQADAGELVVLAAGVESTFERCKPVLESFSKLQIFFGDLGNAATAKLAVNSLFAMQLAGFAEVIGSMTRQGIDAAKAIAFLEKLPITSPATARALGLFASGDFAPNFPIELVAKDLRYAVATSKNSNASASQVEAAYDVFQSATENGLGDLDITGIFKSFQ